MRRRATGRQARRGRWAAWAPVAACLALPLLPAPARRAARDRLLDLHARLARVTGAEAASAGPALDAAEDRVRVLEAELVRLRRALLEAGAHRELAEAGGRARLIPAEALPMGAGRELLHRALLGRGRRDGVLVGQPVLAGDALVGVIAAASEATCEVRLVTDPTFRLRATIARQGAEVEGLLQGDGSGLLAFQPAVLDPAAPVPVPQVGEAVLSSRASLLCGVPAVLGVVSEVVRVPGSTVPVARVRPTVDLDRLAAVVIVHPDAGDGADDGVAGRPALARGGP